MAPTGPEATTGSLASLLSDQHEMLDSLVFLLEPSEFCHLVDDISTEANQIGEMAHGYKGHSIGHNSFESLIHSHPNSPRCPEHRLFHSL